MDAHTTRLIEDYLPIAAINEVAQREKIGHAELHPRKLHLWWARRPLASARAAIYAALVPSDGRSRSPSEEAAWFDNLCRWGGPPSAISKARAEVLAANGGAPPKVLDPFAGGGAIPLEAVRLGCEVTAIEVNPVAHLIEKCMLQYPQLHSGIADDVRSWGKLWTGRVWDAVRDLYPPVDFGTGRQTLNGETDTGRRPLAYLWTRTVPCPNPALAFHRIPLARQTWLARKKGRYIALRAIVDRAELSVSYEVVTASTPEDLGFDPSAGSTRGDATCLICGATVDVNYVKEEGRAGRIGLAPLAAVVLKASGRGRDYLGAGCYALPDDEECDLRLTALDIQAPDEYLVPNYNQAILVPMYGLVRFRDLFTPRQLVTLCTLASGIHPLHQEMLQEGLTKERARAVATFLGLALSRILHYNNSLCPWHNTVEKADSNFGRQAMPMMWDFVETAPFGSAVGDIVTAVENIADIIETLKDLPSSTVVRASATELPLADDSQDAVITDPPYYDNISYADLSDFFYVWLKRSIGFLHPEEFGTELTPKRNEIVSVAHRHHNHKDEAQRFYEQMMGSAFKEAHRVLKPGAPLVCIYAHKTTLGWSSLVDALRSAGFTISEAWPLDTEMTSALKRNRAFLASSIFLVARKRDEAFGIGSERSVAAELDGIIHERLARLQAAGMTGSDLVIATVGAGLAPFTRYTSVEQDNGEPLPSERFLSLVQNRVLDSIFGGLRGADPITRFYVAAQFSYGYALVDFAEANNLAHMTGVELDGPRGLTAGRDALVAKTGSTVQLRDFEERGEDSDLGRYGDPTSAPPPIIDVAQGVLWRAEHRPSELPAYLDDARPDNDLLRNVVQALAGKGLRTGGADFKPPEAAAAERLLGAWRRLVDDNLLRQR